MQQRMCIPCRVIAKARLCTLVSILLFSIISSKALLANGNDSMIDASESPGVAVSPNYYCGLYCVYASAKRLGIDLDFEDLLQPRYLTGRPGSTASDLKSAIEDLGLKCDMVSNLSIEGLARFNDPVIIHTRAGASQIHFSHWMVYAGIDQKNGYQLYDPPFANGTLNGAELQSLWGGTALIVYKDDDTRLIQRWLHSSVPSSKAVFIIASIFICLFCVSQYLKLSTGLGMAITIILACTCTQLPADSFARNWPLVRRQYYNSTDEVKRVSQSELNKFDNAIFVDARSEQQHAVSRVPNAQSLPLGSGILRMKQFISANDEHQPIIVYCESNQCAWAELVAKELTSLGRNNIYVLDEGLRGWKREIADE